MSDSTSASAGAGMTAKPKFKVGQKVLVVKDGVEEGGSYHRALIGDTDTLTYVSEDGQCVSGVKWSYYPHELAPVFKVGDRVRLLRNTANFAAGALSTVTVENDENVGVLLDAPVSRYAAFPHDYLELVEDAPTPRWAKKQYIVAAMDGEQPKPAVRPFVHGNEVAATAEAARLAATAPGTEFAVYQRIAGRVADVTVREVA